MDEQVGQPSTAPPDIRRAVTIDDVARLAGVHRSTVSRALSRPDLVGEVTQQRVNEAVARLGYRTNRVARSLSVGRTGLLAVLVPDCANPYFAEFVKSAQECAAEHDVSVIVASTGRGPDIEARLVRSLSTNVDGIILASAQSAPNALRRVAAGRPVIAVGSEGEPGVDIVLSDTEITRLALEHLWSLGHRSIAVLEGPRSFSSTHRRRMAVDVWNEGRPECRLPVLRTSGENVRDGFAAADELVVLRGQGVTAAIAFSDALAFGLLMRLVAMRVRVPDEISLVGADDVELASFVPAGLTTISLGVAELGRAAVEAALGVVPVSRAALPRPRVVVRGTTAPPAGRESSA